MLNHRTMQDIEQELMRQDRLWGVQNHIDTFWLAILVEEMGELAQELIDTTDSRRDILIEVELVHTISVAVNWLQRRRVNRGAWESE